MTQGSLNTTLVWGAIEKRCRDNFRLWKIDDYMLPSYRNSVDIGSVTVEFMHRGDWRKATCTKWGKDARRNFHALILAFEAVRKADQRGIAGVFADVASAFALPPGLSPEHMTLGVSSSATAEDIRSAYRSRLHETHPDHGGDPEDFKKVREAGRALGVTS